MRVVGVKLCDSELFLGRKLHHKNVEGVGHGSLAVGDLSADHLRERRKELVVVGPVTAGEFSVHEGHEGGWLVDVKLQTLLIVVESLPQPALELEHVPEPADGA